MKRIGLPFGRKRTRSNVDTSAPTRLLVTKAAVISSAMLARKNSAQKGAATTRESIAALADMLSTADIRRAHSDFLQSTMAENALKVACIISLVTVCVHTPLTLQYFWPLTYIIFIMDFISTIILSTEAFIRLNTYGMFSRNESYFRDRWSQFDFFLLIFHWLSLLLHAYECTTKLFPQMGLVYYDWYGVIRCVRPLIIIRLIRLVIKFKLPKNRIQQLLKRSSQQVQNVTTFFVFFMALYAILGIQVFGRMDYHCILKDADPHNITIADLAIPDTMCSMKGEGGYECPDNMVCEKIKMTAKEEGFYGMFNNFGASVFTVYLAASEEGWVYVLYDCMDSLPSYWAFLYFVTLIFFLAWLVKNVFIAVITETFAEIRVQFSEMWQKKDVTFDDGLKQKLETTEEGWRLVKFDSEKSKNGDGSLGLQRILRSTAFQCFITGIVLINAAINASFVYRHDGTDAKRRYFYRYIESGFTILFNIECIVKILCYGFRGFFKRPIFKFELILCIGSTLNLIPYFYDNNYFILFQGFRLLRLIKASPILEDFVYKIFSPGKKLGGLVIFTITFVVICTAISLQLFCSVPKLVYFQTFPKAFMAMFQIITQEGWTDFVVEVLRMIDDNMVPFVAIYFVAYHLFVTLIVLSLFVAVILDNLEMDEELKRVKQLKAREATTTMRTTLPWRLRVFEKFPARPAMVKLKRAENDFPLPKVRGSFIHQFAANGDDNETEDTSEATIIKAVMRSLPLLHHPRKANPIVRHVGPISLKASISTMLEESNRNRAMDADTFSLAAHLGRAPTRLWRKDAQRSRNKSIPTLARAKQMLFEKMTENGDLTRHSDTAPNKSQKLGEIDIRALQQKRHMAEVKRNRIEEDLRENHLLFDRPLFFVGRDSNLRRFCKNIVYAKYATDFEGNGTTKSARRYKELHALVGLMTYLDWTMVIVTSLSCISMLFESPWPTTGENLIFNNVYLQITDYLFVLFMTFELVVKVLANGLFFTPKAVVRDFGGVMTLFIYITSVVFLLHMPKHVEINSLNQLLLIFRAMRPLRIYTLVPHIRRVVVELFRGFKEILLVTILLVVMMFIFASVGVQIVGGKLAACNDPSIKHRVNCTGVFWQKIFVTRLDVYGKNDDELHPSILVPRVWTNPRNFNFDHVGNGMLALFETLSYKGWNVIRDIVWQRVGPWAVAFIHIYVFIGCMIGLTLFVGVVVANYTENRGTALLTVDQRRWHDLKARLKMAQPLHVPPKPSESAKLRTRLYELSMSRPFAQIFGALVVINSATLCIPWSVEEEAERRDNDEEYKLFFATALSAIINILFAVECLLKMTAFTVHGFWQSRRNRVDLLITALGLFWVVLHFFIALPAEQLSREAKLKKFTYTFGYMIVILRFFTIAGRNTTLKMLMLTVVMSMFRSFFIITAMFLFVLFYAYTGVILFGMVKYGQAVSKHVNFRTGSEAMVVLFRSITGEDWNDIMHDCMRSPPMCFWAEGTNYWETDCGNYYGAIIYFCSFYVIITYIVRNLLVAIIMENFSLFYSSEEDALLSYADIRNFQNVWNMVDVEQKRTIPVRRVKFLLRLLRERLEVDPNKDRLLFKHMCYEMERLHNGDDVSFHDVLYMLSYRSVDIRKSLQLEELLQREEVEYIIEEEVAKQTIRTWLEVCLKRMRSPLQKVSVSGPTFVRGGTAQPSVVSGSSSFHANPPPVRPSNIQLQLDASPVISKIDVIEPIVLRDEANSGADEEAGKKKKKSAAGRRSSIPDLMSNSLFQEAAKKFVHGGMHKKSVSTFSGKVHDVETPLKQGPVSKFAGATRLTTQKVESRIAQHKTSHQTPSGLCELEEFGEESNEASANVGFAERRRLSVPETSQMVIPQFAEADSIAIGSPPQLTSPRSPVFIHLAMIDDSLQKDRINDVKSWWMEVDFE
uniref:Sodium leak channel NALCN n=1 Tax=Parascaris univalens TaxID=6257 RepID=A0A915ABY7_PARUN